MISKKTIFFLLTFFLGFSMQGQSKWEQEREKEHGVLRLKLDGMSLDDYYYFVFLNPKTKAFDTLRNREMHLDMGNTEKEYSYTMGQLLKAMPNNLYGQNSQNIYGDWSYVSFPILGLAEGQIVAVKSETKSTMRIHFKFEAMDTADYVFQLNFQEGIFLIEAPLLKHYALSKQYRKHKSTIKESEILGTPFKLLKELSVNSSQRSNVNLSIIDIGNPEALMCFPFYDKIRYSSQTESSLHVIEHPYYTKFKYTSPSVHITAPLYMASDPRRNAYCLEKIYVKPVYLYRPLDYKSFKNRSDLQLNRRRRKTTDDTTFLGLESFIEATLFSKSIPCNEPYYSVTEVKFPFNHDSLVSLEITETFFRLPRQDSLELAKYTKRLNKAIAKAEKPAKKNVIRFFKRRNKIGVSNDPYQPKLNEPTLPMPDYDVEIPKQCDSLLIRQPSRNYLHNGYYSWEAVKPCYDMHNSNDDIQEYYALVVNPYTMEPYDPEVLFGPKFREVVYREILNEYHRLQEASQKIDFPFNVHHYKPELRRRFTWGLDKKHVIIYYGNEGEFSAYQKLKIPLERFK
tara:strand:- start:1327 stop:3033 length:1707 start_codon:yes stop_codon:yes gene_type:complete